MHTLFSKIVAASGIVPYIVNIHSQPAYKVLTGVQSHDPCRYSKPGRGFGPEFSSLYLADCPGVGKIENGITGGFPPNTIIADYTLCAHLLNIDLIRNPGFQKDWRATQGSDRHWYSQEFTRFLAANGFMNGLQGLVWSSVSGASIGVDGYCYGLLVTGAPYLVYHGYNVQRIGENDG